MANSIATAPIYIELLDEKYAKESLTAVLDGDPELVRQGANSGELIIPKMSMDGLADYSRSSGYVPGDVTMTNETVKANYDRGRKFTVDAADNEETAGLAFGRLAGEFLRTKVGPEVDAVRFAQYAGTAGISKISAGATLATGDAVVAAISAGMTKMDNDEVPSEERYLFITPALFALVRDMDTTKSREVLAEFAEVQKVPQSRFYTAIKKNDGTTSGETAGGYAKASGAADINFMIIQKQAVIQFTKHAAPKVIPPELNPDADAYAFGYRLLGVNDVYDNKVAGIYLHHK